MSVLSSYSLAQRQFAKTHKESPWYRSLAVNVIDAWLHDPMAFLTSCLYLSLDYTHYYCQHYHDCMSTLCQYYDFQWWLLYFTLCSCMYDRHSRNIDGVIATMVLTHEPTHGPSIIDLHYALAPLLSTEIVGRSDPRPSIVNFNLVLLMVRVSLCVL